MQDYAQIIERNLNNCLTQTDLDLGAKRSGKVRDTYEKGDELILVTTDRQSAFDRILASIPFKGQVLNETSAWWFEKTKHIIPNHLLTVPDPNVTIATKCSVLPVEFVVRGYITGTTETALWTHYARGVRNYCGNELPGGLRKNEKLSHPILTPTTKTEDHDRPISPHEIIDEGLLEEEDLNKSSQAAFDLFNFGQVTTRQHGLILVDTKYEFGKNANGDIILIDEIHTPDSSRFWITDTYEERFANGKEPQSIDKEFLRLWFVNHCDPYGDDILPEAPEDLVIELSRRYIQMFEMIIGTPFSFPGSQRSIHERIQSNLAGYL
ncbi:MAG: phosphoribosylaminoimidazolesuccinocarboxamide synthase [Candidatus Neomarinimicrobiota bacterium]